MQIANLLSKIEKIVLYGQADYVRRMESYLNVAFPAITIIVYSFPLLSDKVDTTEFNYSIFDQNFAQINSDTLVIIAFSAKFHAAASAHLQKLGFMNIVCFDSAIDNELKKIFFRSYFTNRNKEFDMVYDLPSMHLKRREIIKIYQANSIYDKEINQSVPVNSRYVVPIQVGAALTEKRIAELCDNVGNNISERNRRYSEMTAFYWMWKNDCEADVLGLCHYRRIFVNVEKIAEKFCTTDVDVVLPLPTLCEHSVYDDYLLKHIPTVWQPMMTTLKEKSPEYFKAAQVIFRDKIFYASNMCVLRREVMNDLCEWMFPIVMEVEELVGDIKDTYYNRYAGFCTERLITLYFLYNKHRWKIAHAEKIFIG